MKTTKEIQELVDYCNELQRNCKRITSGNVAHTSANITNGLELIKIKLQELQEKN